jgi:hypothetical protein
MFRWCTLLALLLAAPAGAQESKPGPLKPPEPPKVVRLPRTPAPEPPPVPIEEIIRRFSEKEAELRNLREEYAYRLSVRVQEYDEQDNAAGSYELAGHLVVNEKGERSIRLDAEPVSTLRRATFGIEDVQELVALPLFPLPGSEAEHYDFTYVGQQPLDELGTFLFRVQPKQLSRQRRFFDGVIWVDDRDFAIVRWEGEYVAEVEDPGRPALFRRFEVYRENVADTLWFPTFVRSEERLKSEAGEARLRLVLRYSDYEPLPEAVRERLRKAQANTPAPQP